MYIFHRIIPIKLCRLLVIFRMSCLDDIIKRKADFLAADPEDMYIAHQFANEDFTVFAEIRTVEEPEGVHEVFRSRFRPAICLTNFLTFQSRIATKA